MVELTGKITVTVTEAVVEQLPEVPVTVYAVVVAGVTVIGFVRSPVLHTYEEAPAAVKVAESPAQIVVDATPDTVELMVVVGDGLTVTVAIAVDEQPEVVPVTVYDVVVAGVTEIGFVRSPVVHAYEVAPAAVKVAAAPAQIVGELTVVIGNGLTVTVATAVEEQPKEVPVTVYEVVVAGVTEIGFVRSPVVHAYEVAPAAVKVAEAPSQIVGELTVVTGIGLTVTITVAELVQPAAEVPVTVYVVVAAGFAVTEVPVVALKPVAGAHE